jgi:hypothetical protein
VWVVDVDIVDVLWKAVGVIHSLFRIAPTVHNRIGINPASLQNPLINKGV